MAKKPRFQKEHRQHQHTDLSAAAFIWTEDQLYDQLSKITVPFVLVLDCVQDPHNLGACMRTADAVGVQAVIAPRDKASGLTDTARRVACGGTENTPFVQVTNLARCLGRLKEIGLWLVGTADEVKGHLYGADLTGPLAIVMGAEGKGLRRLTRDHCDFLVTIPMAKSRKVDCLNVSVATGVTLFEAHRQRLLKTSEPLSASGQA